MKTSLDCMECNVKQLIKVSSFCNVSKKQQEIAAKRMFKMLSEISYELTNPEIMGETWKILIDVFEDDNPYKEIKNFYNTLLLDISDDIRTYINKSDNPFMTGLKTAVIGNIIDFAARHKFDQTDVLHRVKHSRDMVFTKDDSKKLEESLQQATSLLYIGDNCGEIVLDKLFIEQIKAMNKDITIYFGVRGGPILNDVTEEDFYQVKMDDIATLVSSGNATPGTILHNTNKEFQTLFQECDVVIAKGQGNFESLSDIKRDRLFLLLMSKCDYVSNTIGVSTMDFVLKENNK